MQFSLVPIASLIVSATAAVIDLRAESVRYSFTITLCFLFSYIFLLGWKISHAREAPLFRNYHVQVSGSAVSGIAYQDSPHCARDLNLSPGPTGCISITTANGGCYGDFSLLNQDGGNWDNTVTSVRFFKSKGHQTFC